MSLHKIKIRHNVTSLALLSTDHGLLGSIKMFLYILELERCVISVDVVLQISLDEFDGVQFAVANRRSEDFNVFICTHSEDIRLIHRVRPYDVQQPPSVQASPLFGQTEYCGLKQISEYPHS